MRCFRVGLVLVLLGAAVAPGMARADGWSWWPFNRETATQREAVLDGQPLRRTVVDEDDNSWWDNVSSGTKRFFSSAGDVLTLRAFREDNSPRVVSEYPNPTPRVTVRPYEPPKSTGPSSWFRRSETPRQPRTPTEFLKQQRPEAVY